VFGGLALALFVAVPCTAAAWMAWRRDPRAATVVELSGWLPIAWIPIEVVFIRTFSPLQPIRGVVGVVLVIFGRRARSGSAGPR
jgi:hypothetical protein